MYSTGTTTPLRRNDPRGGGGDVVIDDMFLWLFFYYVFMSVFDHYDLLFFSHCRPFVVVTY
jgi:hypothetical protein